ncbi:PocR ligand-binding domain-containing protein [Ruminiclostridium papyrosolvens]|uniref:AraC family transcriptional regulator n=1 Tax=Ruminiclostridium papyrosolvens C7 TaxID=1330534 RepID=U4R3B0_9FIRM|nr:PocR ligand-binding domain-containing protein [Ruminiclostridium papyrosolvens]EPR13026.1 AraC family transcriptional regulator [Ruminiclostridium papyrosolvens C7]
MKKNLLDLDYIINADNYRNIQDSIADATDMAIITVDYKGKPITHHSKCTNLCKFVRSHPKLSHICEKCDSRGGLEAARLNQPYIYLCHMGIVDFAIPIAVDGQYLGAVMGGQVRVEDASEMESLEKITSQKTDILEYINKNELKELYQSLPVMKLQKVRANAAMIYNICNYIVGEAVLKINLSDGAISKETGYNNYQNKKTSVNTEKLSINTTKKDEHTHGELLNSRENIILKPALDYIEKYYTRNISLNNMASLCNISTSYFSKLFRRTIGDNFSNYINRIRIKKARELLETTDIPITNIALDLGFEDSGYFIKVFKKFEGVTPSKFRNDAL